jgi:hypothetical protein
MTTNVEIAEFFSQFASAVCKCDLDKICDCFTQAFGFSDPESLRFISGHRQIRELAQLSVERYQALGFNRIKISRLTPNLYESNHATADLEWILLDGGGLEICRFDHSYVLRKLGGLWRIVFVVAHNEARRLRECGLPS